MAAITWDDVEDLQANLSTVPVPLQTIYLQEVNEELNAAAFGGEDTAKFTLARLYRAAHRGEMQRRAAAGAAGEVSSETIGTSSITLSYATGSSVDDSFEETSWGRMYLALLAESPLRFGVTG